MHKVISFLFLISLYLQSDEMKRFDVVYDDENRHYLVYIPQNNKKKDFKNCYWHAWLYWLSNWI